MHGELRAAGHHDAELQTARFAAWLKRRHPNVPLVAWGMLPTALPERALLQALSLSRGDPRRARGRGGLISATARNRAPPTR